jgi:hypothetical protein
MFDSAQIEIPCSQCGRKTKKTVGWLKTNSTLTCSCGTRISIDASQFRRELGNIDKAVNDLKRTFKRFGR